MAYYRKCPMCGANFDPGERCDCMIQANEESKQRAKIEAAAIGGKSNVYTMVRSRTKAALMT